MRLRIVECSQSHLDKCAEHHVLGTATEPLTDWKSGDLVALAVDGGLAALARVRGLPYEEKRRLWPDDVYPYRIQLEFERRLPEDARVPLSGRIRQALSEAWQVDEEGGVAAAIRARRLITGSQAELIVSVLREDQTMPREEQTPVAAGAPAASAGPAAGPEQSAPASPAPAAAPRLVLRNCGFGNDCGRGWDDLVKTELPDVRFCTRCERAVYQCADGDTLMTSLRKGRCVAIEAED